MRSAALVAPFLVVLLCTTLAAAATPLGGWKRSTQWSQEERVLDVSLDPGGFAFESARQAPGAQDVLVGRFDLVDAEYRLELRNQTGDGDVQSLQITFSRLIEFRDSDADGIYEATDATLQTWELDSALPSLREEPGRDGARTVIASYAFEKTVEGGTDRPTVELRFHLSPHTQLLAGVPVPPTETKFDIAILELPYNATDSQVAAEFEVASQTPTRLATDSLQTSEGEFRFGFSWQPTATVDGRTRDVGVSVIQATDTTAGVYFSYPRGAKIFHDPQVGVQQYEATVLQPIADVFRKGSPGLYVLGFLGAALLVGIVTRVRAPRRT
jgi:hypothetical protein